jgi:hypothetical protein
LTEALRRLRKNTSDNNVDRRLVTNILLSFLTTSRADSKRFEMLSLLSTILSWDDGERERAGLQRGAKRPAAPRRKSSGRPERTADEESAMNEVSTVVQRVNNVCRDTDTRTLAQETTAHTRVPVLLQPLCRVPPQGSVAGREQPDHGHKCWGRPVLTQS